jgi:hemerythrin-like domain-containing protein
MMDSIELMKYEHENIKRGLTVLRKMCIVVLNSKLENYDDFSKMIDFIRNYADKHHHSKEEAILFKIMSEDLGDESVKGPLSGMYIEHDLGRLFIKSLEEALNKVKEGNLDARVDVIANAIAYTDLLKRHIDKEDNVIYQFADRSLSSDAKKRLEENCSEVEKDAQGRSLQNNYTKLIEEMEKKWA